MENRTDPVVRRWSGARRENARRFLGALLVAAVVAVLAAPGAWASGKAE